MAGTEKILAKRIFHVTRSRRDELSEQEVASVLNRGQNDEQYSGKTAGFLTDHEFSRSNFLVIKSL
jgi:hypothetical protein